MKDCWVGMKALQGLVTFSITFPSVSLTWTTWPYGLIWKKLVVKCLMSTFSGAKISHKMGHSTLKGHPGNAGCADTALLRTSGRSGGSGFQAWSCSHLRAWLCLWTSLVPGPGALCQCRQTRGPGSSCPDAAVSILPVPLPKQVLCVSQGPPASSPGCPHCWLACCSLRWRFRFPRLSPLLAFLLPGLMTQILYLQPNPQLRDCSLVLEQDSDCVQIMGWAPSKQML